MKIYLKRIVVLMMSIFFIFALVGCATKPDATAKNFLDAVKQQDIQKATTLIKKVDNKENFKFDDVEQEKIIKAVFSKIDYKLDKTTKNGNTATVKAKITSVDLTRVATKMVSELLPTLMAQAFSEQKPDEQKQNDMMLQYMLNSIKDPNAPLTESDVEIKLTKDKEGWLIEPTEDLQNALSGNFNKVSETLGN